MFSQRTLQKIRWSFTIMAVGGSGVAAAKDRNCSIMEKNHNPDLKDKIIILPWRLIDPIIEIAIKMIVINCTALTESPWRRSSWVSLQTGISGS